MKDRIIVTWIVLGAAIFVALLYFEWLQSSYQVKEEPRRLMAMGASPTIVEKKRNPDGSRVITLSDGQKIAIDAFWKTPYNGVCVSAKLRATGDPEFNKPTCEAYFAQIGPSTGPQLSCPKCDASFMGVPFVSSAMVCVTPMLKAANIPQLAGKPICPVEPFTPPPTPDPNATPTPPAITCGPGYHYDPVRDRCV